MTDSALWKLLGSSFLFTGDLEKEGEEELMASYPNLKADPKLDTTVQKGHRLKRF